MKSLSSRRFVPFSVACLLGGIGLLAGNPASADLALFRVQRTFFGAPFPAATPGGAGRSILAVEPYKPFQSGFTYLDGSPIGPGTGTSSPAGVATVMPGNPVGAKFTLPRSWLQYQGTFTLYPSTAFTGYLSQSIVTYAYGQARFRPNNPYAPTAPTTVVHTAATTTPHADQFNFSRNGYLKIDPGPNRFGGTMRYLYAPTSSYYQYISYFNPLFFKGYGSFNCTKGGVTCTELMETTLGETTSSGMVTRKLLGTQIYTNPSGTSMFGRTQYRLPVYPTVASKNYYLHLNAPWTTGKVSAYGANDPYVPHPVSTGYDKQLGGTDLILTRTYTAVLYKGKGKTYYPTGKYYTKLTGVTRAVSLVKPRLTHTYQIPRIPSDPIFSNYQANRVRRMKVFFLPEPGSMLLIASGIAGFAGLALLRRR